MKNTIEVTFREEIQSQDRIRGRLTSGHCFTGKVNTIGIDYFQIVELEVENKSGNFEKVINTEKLDIVKMRYDAIMYFGVIN